MPHILPNRVWENCTVSGTSGNIVPTGAKTAYRTIASQLATNDTTEYTIEQVDSSGNPTGPWEVGVGTMLASGELQRSLCISSSNANAFVNFGAGTYHVFLTASSENANRPRIQVFTTEGLTTGGYVKPAWARIVEVIAIGSGGPGGSGRVGAAGTVRCGGGGGGGGGFGHRSFPASMIISPVDIHVGFRRPGAAAITTNDTNGITAPAQNSAPFGYSFFGRYLQVTGGAPGSGGTSSSGNGGQGGRGIPSADGHTIGAVGGSASTSGGSGSSGGNAYGSGAGGAAGGGISSGNAISSGGVGGNIGGSSSVAGWGFPALPGGANGSSSPPGAGTQYQVGAPVAGSGGGGGASVSGANGQTGGAGGAYGGGGGGGGAAANGFSSGAGGDGAQGIVVVITW